MYWNCSLREIPALYALAQTIKGWLYHRADRRPALFPAQARIRRPRSTPNRKRWSAKRTFTICLPITRCRCGSSTAERCAFLDVNEAACAHYGYTRDEFLRMQITDIRPPDEVAALLKLSSRAGSRSLWRAGEWRHRTKDGQDHRRGNRRRIRSISLASTPCWSSSSDMTERKRSRSRTTRK